MQKVANHMMPASHPFVKAISLALRDRCQIEPGERLLAAVSGGADSTALLLALAALAGRKQWQLDLHVAHVNHHLRESAEHDARFVERLAEQLSLPYHRRDIHPPDDEAEARRMRYNALAQAAEQVDADAIATAHHADDQLETLLMRLIRGASIAGLAGIRWRRELHGRAVVRPMLRLTHAEAEGFCDEAGVAFRVDETNADLTKWRNRLRHDVLPVLGELRADASLKATEAAESLADAQRLVEHHAHELVERHVQFDRGMAHLPREEARRLDQAALRLIVLHTSRRMGVGGDRLAARTVEQVAAAIAERSNENRRFELADGVCVEVAAAVVAWSRAR